MLAWMAFKFIALPKTDLEVSVGQCVRLLRCLATLFHVEQIKMLGNVALQAGVFEHLHAMLKSPYFSGDWVSSQLSLPAAVFLVT